MTGSPRQALAERADERDAAGHRRLEQQVDALRVGDREQLGPDVGEQLLVAGDDRLAGLERGRDQLAGGLDAADHLDDEIDVGILDDAHRVTGEHPVRQRDAAIAGEVAHGDAGDLEPQAGAGLDRRRLLGDERHERGADVAAAEQPDANGAGVVRHARQSNRRPCGPITYVRAAVAGVAPASALGDAHVVVLVDRLHDLDERVRREDRALAPHRQRVDVEQPPDAGVARSVLRVPVTGPDLDLRLAVVALGRERDAHEHVAATADDHDRAVLALRGILLVRHPRPHDLARVGVAVHARRVLDRDDAAGGESAPATSPRHARLGGLRSPAAEPAPAFVRLRAHVRLDHGCDRRVTAPVAAQAS